MFESAINLVKNIDYSKLASVLQQYYFLSLNFYQQNRLIVDLILFAVSFALVMFNLIDMSIISKLYFLGLIYMTVVLLGNFYGQMHNPANLQTGIALMDNNTNRTLLNEFTVVTNNWLLYSSLIVLDYGFSSVGYAIGNGFIFGTALQLVRFNVYMLYCREFIATLEPYMTENKLTDSTFISEETAKSVGVSNYVKNLVNLLAINNVFSYNLLIKTSYKLLVLINNVTSAGVDLMYTFFTNGVNQVSHVKSNVQNYGFYGKLKNSMMYWISSTTNQKKLD